MSSPSPGLARRRFPRRAFLRRVSVLHKGQYFVGHGKEIGEGGMLVKIGAVMSSGDHVLINFLLPATGLSIVQAEVRSVRLGDDTNSYGLLFTNLDYEGKKGIREYIAAKSEQESKDELELLESI